MVKILLIDLTKSLGSGSYQTNITGVSVDKYMHDVNLQKPCVYLTTGNKKQTINLAAVKLMQFREASPTTKKISSQVP